MNRFVTVFKPMILLAFCFLMPQNVFSQISFEATQCVNGYGFDSGEYLIIDGSYHYRANRASEWQDLGFPPDAPEDTYLSPGGADGNTIMYGYYQNIGQHEVRYFFLKYSHDQGETWEELSLPSPGNINHSMVKTSDKTSLISRSNVNNSWPELSQYDLLLYDLETGEEIVTIQNHIPQNFTRINENEVLILVDYAGFDEEWLRSEEGVASPAFFATSLLHYNHLENDYSGEEVFNPWPYADIGDHSFFMHTHGIIELEETLFAATGVGIFRKSIEGDEWQRVTTTPFDYTGDIAEYNGKLYAIGFDYGYTHPDEEAPASSAMSNEPSSGIWQSADMGENWELVYELNVEDGDKLLLREHGGELRVQTDDGCFISTEGVAIEDDNNQIPSTITLDPAYPNPFNPSTTISFALPEALSVSLEVYNITGQRVAVLAQGLMQEGRHDLRFDASDLSSGIYMIHLQAGGESQLRKVTLIK